MAGKWYPHEESIRVPFFVYDPGAPEDRKGARVDRYALNIDVAPTILSLAGVRAPRGMQGIDALPLLTGSYPERDTIFYEHPLDMAIIPRSEAVFTKKFKYIRYPDLEPPFEELYDLENDPHEKSSLVNDTDYSIVLNGLREKMEEMKEEVK